MPKLVPVSLSDVPVQERVRAAQEVGAVDPWHRLDLLLAALWPSDKTYLVSEPAVARHAAKAQA